MSDNTPEQTFPPEILDQMNKAGLSFLHRNLVGVINTDTGGYGSSVAIEYKDETFLFTAAHNLPKSMDCFRFFSEYDTDQFVPIKAVDRNGNKVDRFYGIPLPIHRVDFDSKNDVAFIHTDKETLNSTLKKEPISSEMFSSKYEFGWQGFVHGFPSGYAEETKQLKNTVVDRKNLKIQERYESIIELQQVAHLETFLDPHSFTDDQFNRELTENEIFLTRTTSKPFKHFKGFSGGGIWASIPFELSDDKLFHPTDHLRLVGIQNSASLDSREMHYIRGTTIAVALNMVDRYLDET